MKRLTIVLLLVLFFVIPFIFIFQYDIYSYHVWAYNSLRFGLDEIYNRSNYFDRFCDYLPFGSYIAICQGKIISLFIPLTLLSVPYLNFYKILPLVVLISLFIFLYKEKLSLFKIVLLIVPFYISIVSNGQFDIVILFLIFVSIFLFEKKDFVSGTFILTLLFFSKQTAPFFVLLVFFHYLKENFNKVFFFETLLTFLGTTFLIFFPFIVTGKLFKTLKLIYENSTFMLPFSGYSFNLLSVLSCNHNLDPTKNYFNVSLTSYSLLLIMSVLTIIGLFVKGNVFKKLSLFSLIWFNFLIGLRENHILYPLFFLFFSINWKSKGFKFLFFLFYFMSILNIIFFFFNFLSKTIFLIFSLISVFSTFILFVLIFRESSPHISIERINFLKRFSMVIVSLIFFVVFMPLKNYDRTEKNFFEQVIKSNDIVEFSKDRFIDLNVKTYSPFSHFLSLRMSDLSYIKFKNFKTKYKNLKIFLDVEGNDFAELIINDSFDVKVEKGKNQFIEFNRIPILQDTIFLKSKTFRKRSNLVIYNVTF
ncbi:MAG: hypothetical protein ABIN00_06685 [candidate division WOR-3 bacterium]